jgi:hypothetical protein
MTEDIAIIANPDWMAFRYQSNADAYHFRKVTRDQRERATFLTDEYLGDADRIITIDRVKACGLVTAPARAHFIFHSAFCCSTLLARAFDAPGIATALKEPMVFNDLVGARHRGEAQGQALADCLVDTIHMLARPFKPDEAVIIKPSNVANSLAPAIMALRPDARALLLYAPLETFLKSIAKKGIDGRLWVRDLLVKQMSDGIIDFGFAAQDYLKLTDLQAAAVGWLAQHRLFAQMLANLGPNRAKSLNSEVLLAKPAVCVAALGRHYGLALSQKAVQSIAQGPAFATHSKTGAAFGAEDRAAEYDRAASNHADEIAKVLYWAGIVAENAGIPMDLPHPLA